MDPSVASVLFKALAPVGALAALAAVIVALWLRGHFRREAARGDHIERAARELGFSFQRKDPGLGRLLDLGWRFPLSRDWYHVVQGRARGREILVYDDLWAAGGRVLLKSFANFPAARPDYPEFLILPTAGAWAFRRWGRGWRRIAGLGPPGFEEAYLVQGGDPEAVRAALTPAFLEDLLVRPGLAVESRGGWVRVAAAAGPSLDVMLNPLAKTTDRRYRPEDLKTFVDNAAGLADALLR